MPNGDVDLVLLQKLAEACPSGAIERGRKERTKETRNDRYAEPRLWFTVEFYAMPTPAKLFRKQERRTIYTAPHRRGVRELWKVEETDIHGEED